MHERVGIGNLIASDVICCTVYSIKNDIPPGNYIWCAIILGKQCWCRMLRTGAIWTVTITNMSENPIEMSFWTTTRENKVFATKRKCAKISEKHTNQHQVQVTANHRKRTNSTNLDILLCQLGCTKLIPLLMWVFLETWKNNKLPCSNKLSCPIVHEPPVCWAVKLLIYIRW